MTPSDIKTDLSENASLWLHTTATILVLGVWLLAAIVHKVAVWLWRETVNIYRDLRD
jgi:hypothetical protein